MTETVPPPAEPQAPAAAPPASPLRDAARLLFKGAVLMCLTLGLMLAIFFAVPESNDYAQVSARKHERLARYDAPKIVLVGGSNLAFGIDSAMISRHTGCPVVNMGMNGYLGVRYMLEEVKPELNPSDMVVISFEYDNFYKSVDGTPTDLLVVMKANPAAFVHLSPEQQGEVLSTIPYAAQTKALRLLEDAVAWMKESVQGRPPREDDAGDLIANVESVSGFSPEGDLISHLGLEWPSELGDGIIPADGRIDPQVIGLIQSFGQEMRARGVNVMVSYTPITRDFYQRHAETLNEVHARISASPPLNAPSRPEVFAYDETYFFDTVYHLDAEGRALRTQQVIEDLERHLQGVSMCTQTAQAGD